MAFPAKSLDMTVLNPAQLEHLLLYRALCRLTVLQSQDPPSIKRIT